jgi:hypothetical protein
VSKTVREGLRAALAGLEETIASMEATPEAAQLSLERIGDALRCGVELPPGVRRWMRALSADELASAVRITREEVADLALPGDAPMMDESLPFVLRRRDAAESTSTAVLRCCAQHGILLGGIAGFENLVDELAAFDLRLRACLGRAAAESLLGDRAELLGAQPWTTVLDESDRAAPSETLLWNQAMATVAPSDEAVARYALEGSLAAFIEGFAARSPSFAEELAIAIDAMLATNESVALMPRIWRRRVQEPRAVADPMAISALPPIAAAAATSSADHESKVSPVRLGILAPVAAQARLLSTQTEVSLRVFAASGVIREVEFGGVVVRSPDANDVWSVTIPRTEEPVRVRVVGSDGATFDDTIRLAPVQAT